MPPIPVTLLMSHPARLIVLRKVQLRNKFVMRVTLLVFQPERSSEVRYVEPENIEPK